MVSVMVYQTVVLKDVGMVFQLAVSEVVLMDTW